MKFFIVSFSILFSSVICDWYNIEEQVNKIFCPKCVEIVQLAEKHMDPDMKKTQQNIAAACLTVFDDQLLCAMIGQLKGRRMVHAIMRGSCPVDACNTMGCFNPEPSEIPHIKESTKAAEKTTPAVETTEAPEKPRTTAEPEVEKTTTAEKEAETTAAPEVKETTAAKIEVETTAAPEEEKTTAAPEAAKTTANPPVTEKEENVTAQEPYFTFD